MTALKGSDVSVREAGRRDAREGVFAPRRRVAPGRTRARVDARARRDRRKSAWNERESIVRARREVSRVPRTRERAGIVCGAR
jgi:hypothetical protein